VKHGTQDQPEVISLVDRSKYYRWYRELSNIERELLEYGQPGSLGRLQEDLDRIEKAVGDIRVSVGFYDQVFTLKEHIQMVRQKLFRLKSESSEKLG
jgi:hypothetical protein